MDLSIIIGTYNRCESLRDTLESLLKQERNESFNYEVIVVDNNSDDATKQAVESYMAAFSGKLRYVFESQQGISCARNRGIAESPGKILVFADDDVIFDKNWLHNIWECFQKYNCDSLGGRVLPLYPENTPRWIKDNKDLLCGPIVMHDNGINIKPYERGKMNHFVGANFAVKKTCFLELGLFRTDLGVGAGCMGEDSEIFIRLRNADKKILYCGGALVFHPVDRKRMNSIYFARYFFRLGRFYTKKEYDALKNEKMVCLFGIPRCFIRKIVECSVCLPLTIFDKRKLLKSWINLFLWLGHGFEYKKLIAQH